ncbi:MAG: acyl carrier protein [Candidatus Sumerlaeia bacterium]|nr:acyl carrier protein [Candidatus Sumerlaeia bacterium]
MATTEQRVKDCIVKQLGVNAEEVTPEAAIIDDLGADSLDVVELLMALEEEFDIQIPDEESQNIRTVKEIIAHIESKIA